ncbi:MAG: NADPH-dependent glutamate synthase [Oscillospiraceae bacterium]|nr:NADPH-dependent glutamate synthase [Oscillospiraceae bacterium]
MMEFNMSPLKVKIPEQDPKTRSENFGEVSLGYTPEMAAEEARRCLNCKNPLCVKGCPVNVDIPSFIEKIKEGDFLEAYGIICKTNSLPAVCGRVCPQENQCEGRCVRGKKGEPVGIGRLERFCADYATSQKDIIKAEKTEKNGKRVAVIGSGPGGLSAAGDLIKLGYEVTVFEALHQPGGVLSYGIPEFRLPKEIVKKEIKTLENQGVKIECNMVIGKILTIDELKNELGFDAVYIGSGAGLPVFMGISGENLNGVYSANEFLTRINLMKAFDFPNTDTPIKIGNRAVIIGGGNVAMDAARCAKRLGAKETFILYRRSEKEMPAREEEIRHAKEEGVIIKEFVNPKEIIGDEKGCVRKIRCVKMGQGEPDSSGRPRPVEIENSSFEIEADTVVVAVGSSPNPLVSSSTPGLLSDERGRIVVEEKTGKTNLEGVYAGGDAVTGAATVILAMGAGKKAAAAIHKYLSGIEN